MVDRFANWKASNLRAYRAPELYRAVYDAEARRKLLTEGPEPTKRAEKPKDPSKTEESLFKEAAWTLMEQFRDDPTKVFYAAHKDELKTLVSDPVRSVLENVAARMPEPVLDAMETQKRLFSVFPKNDYGRGGAWPFFWGAFYPTGGKKIEGSQLYVFLDADGFSYGYSVGNYGSADRKKLTENCLKHRTALQQLLADTIEAPDFEFGNLNESEGGQLIQGIEGLDLAGWLQKNDTVGAHVHVLVPWTELLARDLETLVAEVSQAFERLFPLVILATTDAPLPAIEGYLASRRHEDWEDEEERNEEYPLPRMAEETGFELATLQQWVDAIQRKKQAILYGPPGTGKTFVAQRLADHIIGGGRGKKAIVQFHPAYAYEDFIQGLRPESDGDLVKYPMAPGRFLEFCEEVRNLDGLSVLIIDEINRAELSRVFGELMYLLEYRDEKVRLASGQQFSIPKKLRIIGTMNTADRSIALVDNALRRRFAFLPLYPDDAVLRRFHERNETGYPIEPLLKLLARVNNTIDDPHFHVGVSFFMDTQLDANIEAVWRLEIEPYLDEYFFNRREDVAKFRWEKVKSELQANEGQGGD